MVLLGALYGTIDGRGEASSLLDTVGLQQHGRSPKRTYRSVRAVASLSAFLNDIMQRYPRAATGGLGHLTLIRDAV